jgi:hypothetical protein
VLVLICSIDMPISFTILLQLIVDISVCMCYALSIGG